MMNYHRGSPVEHCIGASHHTLESRTFSKPCSRVHETYMGDLRTGAGFKRRERRIDYCRSATRVEPGVRADSPAADAGRSITSTFGLRMVANSSAAA